MALGDATLAAVSTPSRDSNGSVEIAAVLTRLGIFIDGYVQYVYLLVAGDDVFMLSLKISITFHSKSHSRILFMTLMESYVIYCTCSQRLP